MWSLQVQIQQLFTPQHWPTVDYCWHFFFYLNVEKTSIQSTTFLKLFAPSLNLYHKRSLLYDFFLLSLSWLITDISVSGNCVFRDYNAEKDAWGDQCESLKLLNCKISCPRVTSCSQVFNNHMRVYCLVSFLSLDLTEYFWVVDKTRHLEDVILCFGNQISLFGAFCRTNNKSINQLQL